MFGFLTSGAKEIADPLVSAKTTAAWLRQLPALDVIGRQQHVMGALDAMRQSRRAVDPARALAVQYLDAALGADRRQLIKQYVENYDAAPKLSRRDWLQLGYSARSNDDLLWRTRPGTLWSTSNAGESGVVAPGLEPGTSCM